MSRSKYITRKEIAGANEVSEATVRRRIDPALKPCRDNCCNKPVRYERDRAEKILRERGLRVP